MKDRNQFLSLLLAVILISFSCKKEETKPAPSPAPVEPTPTLTLVKIGETYLAGAGAKAMVYAKKAFETGYNEVYVALYDSSDGSKLNTGHFDVEPMMDMGMMEHSCPVETPKIP